MSTVDELEVFVTNNKAELGVRSFSLESNESSLILDEYVEEEREVSQIGQIVVNNKLPLHNKWSFWYIKNDRLKNWKDNLIKIIDFSYVEDFWSIFNYLVSPSVLETGTDLALFKAGIEPMWEGTCK